MKKITLYFSTLMAVILIASACPSYSQYESLLKNGISIRAGVFMPTDSDAKDLEGDQWLTVGAEWRFKDFPMPAPVNNIVGHLTLSVDYYGKGDLYAIPINLNYRGQNDKFFYYAGLGTAFTKDLDGGTDSAFGWNVGAGFDVIGGPLPISVGLRYNKTNANGLDGFSLLAGVRF